jgi:ComF family protein
MRLTHVLADVIAPPLCAICAATCATDHVLCPRCDRELTRGRPLAVPVHGITRTWAARAYEGAARDLITALKFRRLLPAAARAAELVAAEAPSDLLDGTLVPVPPDPLRHLIRGFDPANEIADGLARLTTLPVSTCLRRHRGARQVGRKRRERLGDPPRVRLAEPLPKRPLLLDDVTTTGATLAACAAALRAGGCAEVRAVVLAAAPA